MSLHSLYLSSTSICDFAYDENHPLRQGQFPFSASESDDDSDYDLSCILTDDGSSDARLINLQAVALFDFIPENDNEIELREGQSVWISYRHGQGWLVAEDPNLGKNGLVPEEYVDFLVEENELEDDPRQFMPQLLQLLDDAEDEWEDVEEELVEVAGSSRPDDGDNECLEEQMLKIGLD